jgi:hypothetical protein
MAAELIDRPDPGIGSDAPCARCAGRPVWRDACVHTFDLATGERRASPAVCCAICGALTDAELDEAPVERARTRAYSPASRGLSMLALLRDGLPH